MDPSRPLHRSLAYVLLRLTFGAIFLTFGIQKLATGPRAFSGMLLEQFAKSPLPLFLVRGFGLLLPFLETALGGLIVLGLFTVPVLACTALLLIALTFGLAVSGQGQFIPNNMGYIVIGFILLFAAEYNRWALDDLRRAKSANQAGVPTSHPPGRARSSG